MFNIALVQMRSVERKAIVVHEFRCLLLDIENFRGWIVRVVVRRKQLPRGRLQTTLPAVDHKKMYVPRHNPHPPKRKLPNARWRQWITYWILIDDFFMTSWWRIDDDLTTFPWRVHIQRWQNVNVVGPIGLFLDYFRWLPDLFSMNRQWLVNDLWMASWWFSAKAIDIKSKSESTRYAGTGSRNRSLRFSLRLWITSLGRSTQNGEWWE